MLWKLVCGENNAVRTNNIAQFVLINDVIDDFSHSEDKRFVPKPPIVVGEAPAAKVSVDFESQKGVHGSNYVHLIYRSTSCARGFFFRFLQK